MPRDPAFAQVFPTSRTMFTYGAIEVSEPDSGPELHILGLLRAKAFRAFKLPRGVAFSYAGGF